ncbi:hypothetical protein LINGRAHAP2_LOCUS25511 [Linum grandiflorum]
MKMATNDHHHTKLLTSITLIIFLLIFFVHPSLSIRDGVRAGADQGKVEMDMVELDYVKDPGANTRHLPAPKSPKPAGVGG